MIKQLRTSGLERVLGIFNYLINEVVIPTDEKTSEGNRVYNVYKGEALNLSLDGRDVNGGTCIKKIS